MKLIYFSPVSWSSFTQRPHEFVWFCRATLGCDVIWIEPYPVRIPKFTDLHRINYAESPMVRDVPDWMTLIVPQFLPVEPLPFIRCVNFWALKGVIRALTGCTKEDIFVIGKPSLLAKKVLNYFKPMQSLYDAMDDFPQFYQGISSRYMERLELDIATVVKKISVSSHHLMAKFVSYGHSPLLILNACSVQQALTVANSVAKVSGLKVGYIGTIGEWFDWDFVISLAQYNPTVAFDIIGPIFQRPSNTLPENITIKAAVTHSKAMELMSTFDIGLIPFKCNKLTHGVDPIKYYEYKRFGLSIISSRFGEMAYRAEEMGVYLVDFSAIKQVNLHQLQKTDPSSVVSWSERFSLLPDKFFV